jgi:hypothetical protein
LARETYAIWDFESGNLLAAYDTEPEALALVYAQISEYGPESVCQWGLSRERRGRLTALAEGAALAERALAQAPVEPRSATRAG